MRIKTEIMGRIAIALAEYSTAVGRINPTQYERAMTVALEASPDTVKKNSDAYDYTMGIKHSIEALKNSGDTKA